MPSRVYPGIGLRGDWALGENGWKDEMDTNLLTLSVLAGQQVDQIAAALPGSPAEGDIVILDAAHGTNPNKIAVYDEAAWRYITPIEGLTMYNLALDVRYEFKDGVWTVPTLTAITVEAVAGAAYTFALADAGKHKRFTNAGAVIATIPPNSTHAFAIGTRIRCTAAGAAGTTLAPGAGVTIRSRGAVLASAGQYAVFEIEKVGADEWDALGDLA